jgi:hypothetical protein
MNSERYKRKLDTREELLFRILDAAARIKKRKDQLRRTTPDFRTRLTRCIEVDGGIFEHLRAAASIEILTRVPFSCVKQAACFCFCPLIYLHILLAEGNLY